MGVGGTGRNSKYIGSVAGSFRRTIAAVPKRFVCSRRAERSMPYCTPRCRGDQAAGPTIPTHGGTGPPSIVAQVLKESLRHRPALSSQRLAARYPTAARSMSGTVAGVVIDVHIARCSTCTLPRRDLCKFIASSSAVSVSANECRQQSLSLNLTQ